MHTTKFCFARPWPDAKTGNGLFAEGTPESSIVTLPKAVRWFGKRQSLAV